MPPKHEIIDLDDSDVVSIDDDISEVIEVKQPAHFAPTTKKQHVSDDVIVIDDTPRRPPASSKMRVQQHDSYDDDGLDVDADLERTLANLARANAASITNAPDIDVGAAISPHGTFDAFVEADDNDALLFDQGHTEHAGHQAMVNDGFSDNAAEVEQQAAISTTKRTAKKNVTGKEKRSKKDVITLVADSRFDTSTTGALTASESRSLIMDETFTGRDVPSLTVMLSGSFAGLIQGIASIQTDQVPVKTAQLPLPHTIEFVRTTAGSEQCRMEPMLIVVLQSNAIRELCRTHDDYESLITKYISSCRRRHPLPSPIAFMIVGDAGSIPIQLFIGNILKQHVSVYLAADIGETCHIIQRLARLLVEISYRSHSLYVPLACERADARMEETGGISFESIRKFHVGQDGNAWVAMLSCLVGISESMATDIAVHFPSINSLIKLYDREGPRADDIIANKATTRGRIGPAISRTLRLVFHTMQPNVRLESASDE